jgi:hypothetical protein
VFDVLGRIVATLADDKFVAGQFTRQWDADVYAGGVYVIRMIAGRHTETQKVMLIK